jgi:hypothetical protein
MKKQCISKYCHVFFDEDSIIITSVDYCNSGFYPYGDYMKRIKIGTNPIQVGESIINALNLSKIVSDKICIEERNQTLYKFVGVEDWNQLGNHWNLISVTHVIYEKFVNIRVFTSNNLGTYQITPNSPFYTVDLKPLMIGEQLNSIIISYTHYT